VGEIKNASLITGVPDFGDEVKHLGKTIPLGKEMRLQGGKEGSCGDGSKLRNAPQEKKF